MAIYYIMNKCLAIFLRGVKVNVVQYGLNIVTDVNGEQVITLQMSQLLKIKNINIAPGQLFCRQCKAKLLLETDSLH